MAREDNPESQPVTIRAHPNRVRAMIAEIKLLTRRVLHRDGLILEEALKYRLEQAKTEKERRST